MLGLSQILNSLEKCLKKGLSKSPFFLFNKLMKKELRKWAKEKRLTLSVEDCSSQIKNYLFSSEIYKNAKNIMCYYSVGSEVSTVSYFQDESKNWFMPKVQGEEMFVCSYVLPLIDNCYKIPESMSEPVSPKNLDLIIIPALCVDKNGYRIGYGKGYYDKFLKGNSRAVRVVVSFDELLVDNVFPDEFDEKVDYVITEKGIYKI